MVDVIETDADQTDVEDTAHGGSPNEATDPEQVEEPKAEEPKATKNVSKPCLCSYFEVGNFDPNVPEKDREVFSTGCERTTQRIFAQGHDARLVSFLVDAYFDGYAIRMVGSNNTFTNFATPAGAAAKASEALRDKAIKATENRRNKIDAAKEKKDQRESVKAVKAAEAAKAKAEKDKAKADAKAEKDAAKANTPQAEVVAGSQEGDRPEPPEGIVRIKVGRWEYDAEIDADGNARFTDGKGEAQVMERDGYRILQNA